MAPKPRPPECSDVATIAARAFVTAEDRERARLDARVWRLYGALASRGEPQAFPRALEAAAAAARDGAAATGRLDARVRPAVATDYDGDSRVSGPIAPLCARVRPDAGAASARERAAIARADRTAAAAVTWRTVRARYVPGGAYYDRAPRAEKRRLRAVIDRADALARAGRYADAIALTRE